MGKAIMLQGTGSDVGKSLLTAAFCRIFSRAGLKTVPFKSQNMALNSAVTSEGLEMGRAQYYQAQAARVEPTVQMNPILQKPITDTTAQIIVQGQAVGNMSAQEYIAYKPQALQIIQRALAELQQEYELVVIEGGGSPAEINLRRHDIVNWPVAQAANAPVLLVADIDLGGVFAYTVGTLSLLNEEERSRVQGIIINKFRGDRTRFATGVQLLEQMTEKPVVGVVPFISDLQIPEEDAVPPQLLDDNVPSQPDKIQIGIVYVPHIANFTDFDPFAREASVQLRYMRRPQDLSRLDLVILPGSKNTLGDLQYLYDQGWVERIRQAANMGIPIFGVCAGFQMLGTSLRDPYRVESELGQMPGLGLLPTETEFASEKVVRQSKGTIAFSDAGMFHACAGLPVAGYELHMGRSVGAEFPLIALQPDKPLDGAATADGMVAGSYLHGLFDMAPFRRQLLKNIAQLARTRGRVVLPDESTVPAVDPFDLLAEQVATAVDLDQICRIAGIHPRKKWW